MMYLDTHAVIWLYQKDKSKFTPKGLDLLGSDELFISPIIRLELEYLFEIDRIKEKSHEIIEYLCSRINLNECKTDFISVIKAAATQKWTRDPFDRIITAQAALKDSVLLSKDEQILKHYYNAVW